MIGYKDMTWCPEDISSTCSSKDKCHRVFTESVRANAEKWWGGSDFPIAFFAEQPHCYKKVLTKQV